MTTITRERLLKIQQWCETYGPGSNVVLPAEEAEELARIALASLTAEPTVTFYRDVIEVAATWVDQQRESYDSEHGRHDPDTGAFEFGNDAQRDYSATLEEIAEGIRALHTNTAPPAPVSVPDENGLLPCPCCGGKADFDYDDDNLNWISCSVCGIATDTAYHTDVDARDKLREVWNSRAAMLQGSQPVSNRDELPPGIKPAPELDSVAKNAKSLPGNSPVIPDGYVMVPIDATRAMIDAAARVEEDGYDAMHKAMIAAAPQQEVK